LRQASILLQKAFGYVDITIAPDAACVIGRTAVFCPGPVPAPADEMVSSVCGRAAAALWIDPDAASMSRVMLPPGTATAPMPDLSVDVQ
jgi:hypothetical protein